MRDRNPMNSFDCEDLINHSFTVPSSDEELINRDFSVHSPDDDLVSDDFTFPPPDNVMHAVNPWRRAMNRVLWGLALTTVTFNFALLNYILPVIGVLLMLLGFRTLRRENGWFKGCYILSILQAAIRFPCLILNATIYQRQIYAAPIFDALTAVNLTATLVQIFCLWRSFKSVQRKAGVPEHAGGAVALMVWYALVLLMALVNYTGLLAYAVVIIYIFIIRALFKLSKALDEAGYAIQAAPVRVPDWLVATVIVAVLLIGITCGYLFANHYPMEWTEVDPAAHEEVAEIKADLIELGFPEDVLNDLTAEDIQACEGALQVVTDVADLSADAAHSTSKELRITGVAVQLYSEREQWKLFHHFRWLEDPGFYGTEALQLWPASRLHEGWSSTGQATGQVLYTKDGQTLASPYHSLGSETYTSNSWFSGAQTSTDVFAQFSMPRNSENQRGYISYAIQENINGYIIDSWINYIHQQHRVQYPALTAKEYRISGAWDFDGPFFIIQDALQIFSPKNMMSEQLS